MKYIKTAALLLMLSALFLASCAKDEEEGLPVKDHIHFGEEGYENQAPPTKYPTDSASLKKLTENAMEILTATPEYPDAFPTLEDVTEQYKEACMAIGWVVGTEGIATDPDDTYKTGGIVYERIRPDCYYGAHALKNHAEDLGETVGLIYNLRTLRAYFETLMSKEDAEGYIEDIKYGFDYPKFVHSDKGGLYGLPYSYSVSGKYGKEETYELSANGDGSYTFTVNYTVIQEDKSKLAQSHSFRYEKIDGRWVFVNFVVIKQ